MDVSVFTPQQYKIIDTFSMLFGRDPMDIKLFLKFVEQHPSVVRHAINILGVDGRDAALQVIGDYLSAQLKPPK